MNCKTVGLAVVAALCCFEVISPTLADTVISGKYDFEASNFSVDAPISEITGSFSFTYAYASTLPPIAGQSPLLIPTTLELNFNSTTFSAADTSRPRKRLVSH